MTTGGWINLFLSVGFVTVLFCYCVLRVIRGPGANRDRPLPHVEPVDENEADRR